MLTEAKNAVADFHRMFGYGNSIGDEASPAIKNEDLRFDLIDEEVTELWEALYLHPNQGSPAQVVEAADALGDIIYVCLGAAVEWGIPIERVFEAIHKSNMTKEGGGSRPDGKILKGPNYQPPKIAEAIWPGAR